MKNELISLETKKSLAGALKHFMALKSFEKITVKEIIEYCGVNRNTFYYHFEDIYSLLRWMFQEEAIDVVKNFDLLLDYEDAIRFVMQYVDDNEAVIASAYSSLGRDELKRFFYGSFIDITRTCIQRAAEESGAELEEDFKTFLAAFYSEAIAGTLLEWAMYRHEKNREQTVLYLTRIIQAALSNLVNL